MTRAKKWAKAQGISFSEDYPYLPYDVGSVTIEDVGLDAETMTVIHCLNVIIIKQRFLRNGELVDVDD